MISELNSSGQIYIVRHSNEITIVMVLIIISFDNEESV